MAPQRRHLLRASLVALLLLAVGCAGDAETPGQAPHRAPMQGGVVHYAQIAPSSLDPAIVYDSYDAALVNLIHAGLLRHDRNFGIRPDVAHSWQIEGDGALYRFRLRDDVRFHDGRKVSADDVVYSLQRVFDLDPETTTLARQYLGVIQGADTYVAGDADSITGLHAVDTHVLEIRLERPYAGFLNVMASEFARIVPRPADGADASGRIGCGPFAMESWKQNAQIVLRRHDDYHGGPAYLDGVVVHTPPDPVSAHALDGFAARRLHLVELTNVGEEALTENVEASLHHRLELSLTFLAFTVDRPPFDDVRIRRAIAHGVDVAKLPGIDATRRPVANGVLPPGFPGYQPLDKRLQPDRALADSLMAATKRPGRPLVIGIPRRGPVFERLATELCARIEDLGLEVEARQVEWAEFDSGLRQGVFDAFLLTWVADIPDPDSFFFPLFHSDGSVNHLHYVDSDVDAWLEIARREVDRNRRLELYRRAERRVLDDAVIVPLHFNSTVFAVRSDVQGFEITSMGGSQLRLESVWFDTPGVGSAR